MNDISDILSSKAKVKVLEILAYPDLKIPLRHIAELCGQHVRSVELALNSLCKTKLLYSQKKAKERYFWLNKNHSLYALVLLLFENVRHYYQQQEASQLSKRAKSSIQFSESAMELFKKIK